MCENLTAFPHDQQRAAHLRHRRRRLAEALRQAYGGAARDVAVARAETAIRTGKADLSEFWTLVAGSLGDEDADRVAPHPSEGLVLLKSFMAIPAPETRFALLSLAKRLGTG
jgi:hypothetical protein